jgi:hypothetical protein
VVVVVVRLAEVVALEVIAQMLLVQILAEVQAQSLQY